MYIENKYTATKVFEDISILVKDESNILQPCICLIPNIFAPVLRFR